MNGHSSLLPRFRGSSTEFWQLADGETETGVTIHWMAPKVDEGRILVQRRWPIHPGTSHWQLRVLSQFLRIDAWKAALRMVHEGVEATPQPLSDQATFGNPQLADFYRHYVTGAR